MNYEMHTFGMDIFFTVSEFEEPFILPRNDLNFPLNEEFIQSMVQKEHEGYHFSTLYYNKQVLQHYTFIYQTCSIKDLDWDAEDRIIVKKYEEDS